MASPDTAEFNGSRTIQNRATSANPDITSPTQPDSGTKDARFDLSSSLVQSRKLTGLRARIAALGLVTASIAGPGAQLASASSEDQSQDKQTTIVYDSGFLYTAAAELPCAIPEVEIKTAEESGGLAFFNYYTQGESNVGGKTSTNNVSTTSNELDAENLKDCPPEIEKDEVQTALDAWTTKGPDGKWLLEDTPERFLAEDLFTILNLQGTHVEEDNFQSPTGMLLQGKLLAFETVSDHLIGYLGYEDWGESKDGTSVLERSNNRYYVAFNFGQIDNKKIYPTWTSEKNSLFSRTGGKIRKLSSKTLSEEIMPKEVGEVIGSQIFPFEDDPKNYPAAFAGSIKESNQSVGIARDFVRFSWAINNSDPAKRQQFTKMIIPKSLSPIINTRITDDSFSVDQIPTLLGIIRQK